VSLVARVLGPVLCSKGQEATSRAQLVGQIGVVISSVVDESFGEVRIRDKTGHDVRLVCKLSKGSGAPVPENKSVVVVDYDDEHGDLLVEAFEDDEPRRAAK
jgi:membrane protein implicated in regulation of membrane protease activity